MQGLLAGGRSPVWRSGELFFAKSWQNISVERFINKSGLQVRHYFANNNRYNAIAHCAASNDQSLTLHLFFFFQSFTMPSAFVPESVLKKRRTTAALATAKDASDKVAAKKATDDKAAMMKRAETYVTEYKTLENDSIRLRREAKASGSYYVPAMAKLAFVTRIRGASFPRVDLDPSGDP
jgi:hypothetical protein